ncbi:grasp-with-spasm system ATP-grasp peptide maturase [Flavobacterium sp. HNIBRBA15423]|uniref:grasp-with-spasm system ATP-grasp peptide maturase n=1 Tax=Flavobacterium sp. HNIBRBA15423 TaxID=3458683 RepID=UPI00404420E9
MILILSENGDLSTTQVIQWLDFLKKKWIRINVGDDVDFELIGDDVKFLTNKHNFKLSEIQSIWFRRGFFSFKFKFSSKISVIDDFLKTEFKKIIEYIYYKLSEKKCINNIETYDVNKLVITSIAKDFNLNTPKDLLFTNPNVFEIVDDKKYITKSISGLGMFSFEDFTIYNYTRFINKEKNTIKSAFPSLIQDYIEKKYELRIFYLNEDFYSMAIFSQQDKTTSVDFRNYNRDIPNRTVPFILPDYIKMKLIQFTKKININCGSIDMIVTPQNEYVFLEINPVGQFGMTSYPCNYNLEKKIANYL